MNKNYFITLLHKYLKEELSIKEKQLVESYYSLFENEPDVIDALSTEEKNEIKNAIKNSIWTDISKKEHPAQKIKFLNSKIIKIAATIFIMAFLSSLFFFSHRLPQKQVGQLTNVVNLNSKINRIIFLPDSTTVILSPGSKLNYLSSFNKEDKREVFIEGQAFFDVKHNKLKPFIVHAGKLQTIVLGTAFNIKAIFGENDITVTVKRGRVKVTDQNKILGVITPNQQITYNKERVSCVLKTVKNDSYLEWKEQDLFIDNLTLSEAAKLIEDQYKVKIIISDSLIREHRFTATLPKQGKLEQDLKSICLFNGLIYLYDKEKSIVIIKNK